jgi:cell division protein FtsW
MPAFARTDTSVLGRWWWTVDRWSLMAVILLAAFGLLLAASASPAVAERLSLESTYFLKRQAMFLVPAAFIMLGVSLMTPRQVRRFGVLLFFGSVALLCATLVVGSEIKGAQRWISVAGFSLQPSEFAKPGFAVFAAWMFANGRFNDSFPGGKIAFAGFAVVALLLLAQPDIGQLAVLTAIWFAQWFLAGLPMMFVAGLAILSMIGLAGAYFIFPHVASRINRFIDPQSGDTYQIDKANQAFGHGGLFGTGPGEGVVKTQLPDAHADFIFAVVGEEFGLIVCLVLVFVFAFVVLRGFFRLMRESDLFVVLAAGGLLVQFGVQALINMGSTVSLIPTKGMTLPFVSYGGSSMLALAIGMGMVLALTRERPGGAL